MQREEFSNNVLEDEGVRNVGYLLCAELCSGVASNSICKEDGTIQRSAVRSSVRIPFRMRFDMLDLSGLEKSGVLMCRGGVNLRIEAEVNDFGNLVHGDNITCSCE